MKEKPNAIESIRQNNTILVLNVLRRSDQLLSRPQVADSLDLSKVTISNIVKELKERGLVTEAGYGAPGHRGGRKPLLVTLNRDLKRVIGARLGHSTVEVSLCDITGREINRRQGQANSGPGLLARLTKDLIQATNTSEENILGLAVAAGPDSAENQGPEEMAAKLQADLGFPVWAASFTTARAFAECWHLNAENRASFFYVNLGHRVDCAAVREGLPDPRPSEFGSCHISALSYGQKGRRVTVESLIGGQALLDKAAGAYKKKVNIAALKDLAAKGDGRCLEILDEYGYWLGCGLALAVNMTGLSQTILGGALSGLWPYFETTMKEGLKTHISERLSSACVRVIDHRLADGLQGAVCLALDRWVFRTDLLYGAGECLAGTEDTVIQSR